MTITITAFAAAPDRGEGQARDMRVRWALEELGRPYDVRLVSYSEMKAPAHRRLHPFGQIPTFEEDGLVLFESGAILLHLAERHPGLLPTEPHARARAAAWLFAALNTVEPPIVELEMALLTEADRAWTPLRRPMLEARVRTRLDDLATALGDADWLDGPFGVADLMMVTVLRRLDGHGLIGAWPRLAAYVARAEARPAYRRAFAAQRAVFEASRAGADPAL